MSGITRTQLVRLTGISRVSALYLLAVIAVVFSIWIPDLFWTSVTFKQVLSDQVVVASLGLAALVPLLAGAFDVSVGAMAAWSLVILAFLRQETELSTVLCCLLALLGCAAFGLVNGYLVVNRKINSFVATLGTSQVMVALALLLSKNQYIVGQFPQSFRDAGTSSVLGIPVLLILLLVLALVLFYVTEWTRYGRVLFATGSNPDTARLAGVRTNLVVYSAYVISAVVAGLGGIVYAMRVGTFNNGFAGSLLFPAFAAVFLGATQFARRPNVWGTVLAVYTLAFGVKGLQLALDAGTYWITPLFNGLALLLAVVWATTIGPRRATPRRSRRSASEQDTAATAP